MTATATKETGILFSAPMVKAIRDGRKTVTRRVCKLACKLDATYRKRKVVHRPNGVRNISGEVGYWEYRGLSEVGTPVVEPFVLRCSYGTVGDRLVLLSSWSVAGRYDDVKPTDLPKGVRLWTRFDGTDKPAWCGKLRPGRFLPLRMRGGLPRAELTEVRVERLQEISEADAKAEGCNGTTWPAFNTIILEDGRMFEVGDNYCHGVPKIGQEWCGSKVEYVKHQPPHKTFTAVDDFRMAWIVIHGPDSWTANPWVWVVGFKVLKGRNGE